MQGYRARFHSGTEGTQSLCAHHALFLSTLSRVVRGPAILGEIEQLSLLGAGTCHLSAPSVKCLLRTSWLLLSYWSQRVDKLSKEALNLTTFLGIECLLILTTKYLNLLL